MPHDVRGCRWRKWDLHVHTPESIVQQYGAGIGAWESFLADLEGLPSEFAALGINDYIFIDGYRRVRKAKQDGRLPKIELILPVIELRLDKFGGAGGALSRVNFHIIFSDVIDPDVIEMHFLKALPRAYKLSPEYEHFQSDWKALPTRDSIAELGKKIIESVPPQERSRFGSPLQEGFNNINFSLDQVLEVLESHYFRGRFLLSVGKTEWADIKWNDNTIAEKKNIINRANFVFSSNATSAACEKARLALRAGGVNARLLDCSDAHHHSSAQQKDRVGKCFTWLNCDTTFSGLKHAEMEYDTRVSLGDEPEKLQRIRSAATRYVSRVSVHKRAASTLQETWFDYDLPLNPGLVAIIGNKGSGKSALADTIGHLGHSRRAEYFSFLSRERFRHLRWNKARHFNGCVEWASGESVERGLEEEADQRQPERIKYIPQNLIERLCNGSLDTGSVDFERELRQVIYSHVPEELRLNRATLEDLIDFRTAETNKTLELLRHELHDINEQIFKLEAASSPDSRRGLDLQLEAKQKELVAHDARKPTAIPPPAAGTEPAQLQLAGELKVLSARRQQLEARQAEQKGARSRQQLILSQEGLAEQKLKRLQMQFKEYVQSWKSELPELGLDPTVVASLTVNEEPLTAKKVAASKVIAVLDREGDAQVEGSVASELLAIESESRIVQERLGEPAQRHDAYIKALQTWTKKREEIVGSPMLPGSVEYVKNQIETLDGIPARLQELALERARKSEAIHEQLLTLRDVFRELYQPVQEFIAKHDLASRIRLQFDAAVSESGFVEGLFELVSKGAAGSFRTESGVAVAKGLVSKYDFDDFDEVAQFQRDVLDYLSHDKRSASNDHVLIEEQLKSGHSKLELFDLVFGLRYLLPRYSLRLADREIGRLSPGERGSLLLVFFLLVDTGGEPLVIDQPEENLDNQTVYELLVPAIGEAVRRRQVILVTHNPNLAVVCDADQVIFATFDRAASNRIAYVAGAIENPMLNKHIIDVLEGTRPAFENREVKYKLATLSE